jgi:hypothetical protein
MALVTALLVWALTSLVATVDGNRTTWLLFALIVLAARLAAEDSHALTACFSAPPPRPEFGPQKLSDLVEV